MIYPESFEEKTGFNLVREMISGFCLCNMGRENTSGISFMSSPDAITLSLRQTDEFRKILLFGDELTIGHIHDAIPGLKKLRIEGTFMEAGELHDLSRSLDTARGILNYFRGGNPEKYPALSSLAGGVRVPLFVRDRLNAIISKEGGVKDSASPALLSIRRDITMKQSAVSKKLHSVMKAAQLDGIVEKDASIAIRNGRPVIPVNASLKRKIRGFVHDESASGRTAYIEPAGVVELNNEIRELEHAERREVLRILRELADAIRPYLDELFEVFDFLGLIDFIRAKAMFAVKLGCIVPVIHELPVIRWKNALHPLLFLSLRKEQRETVPLDIELNDDNRILVISGPNAGGKSVCLQTVGLLQYMIQCGIPVPMSENSETGIFDGIFIDIGDEQSIENDLSTYSSHLINMKFFLRHSSNRSLILIDEFGAGTEPVLGGAIAESILEQLNRNLAFGVVTTHYTNLKHFAASEKGLVNGAMLYDTGKMEPLFRLETGKPGSSFAFEIARKIGLPEDILQSASHRAGEGHIEFDKHLRDIIRDKHYWDRKRKNIRQLEKKLEHDLQRYLSHLEKAKKEEREILSKAREQAGSLLDEVNRRIEKTIKEIRESQAEKEKTREAREKLENLRKKVGVTGPESGLASHRIEKIIERQERLRRKTGKAVPEGGESSVTGPLQYREETLVKGDIVRMAGKDITGEVLDRHGKSVMVAFGNMITTLDEDKVEKVSRNEAKKIRMNREAGKSGTIQGIREKKLNFRAEKDVRGMRGDEALGEVGNFIDDALMVGAREVRILHGKGNGILRQLIRDYLNAMPEVRSFRDEHIEFGGSGITVVEFEY